MKKILIILIFLVTEYTIHACPVCERNQPKILRGIVHGAGPDSNWDYVSVYVTGIIAILALFYSIKWLIRPNEKNTDHVKYSILNPEK